MSTLLSQEDVVYYQASRLFAQGATIAVNFDRNRHRIDFLSPSASFFWLLMLMKVEGFCPTNLIGLFMRRLFLSVLSIIRV